MADNETIADIIAEMRDWLGDANSYDLRSLADRLEAAWKRECATAEKSSTVGDAAKLREACQKMRDLLMRRGDGKALCILTWDEFNESQKMLRAALSAPPRNCDVGTAEEQYERWQAFCNQYDKDCTGCPCRSPHTTAYCFAKWGQMPYGEEQKGESK